MHNWVASAAVGTAAASIAAGVATVSGTTPFSSCQDDPQTVVQNAEVEPSLAVDPRRPARAYVAYQQDRFRDGAARGIVVGTTNDGGRAWRRSVIRVGFCATGSREPFRVTDPWVSVGADGRVYVLASSSATTSSDGGTHWTPPVALTSRTAQTLPDKGSLTADPVHAGVAYAVWARFVIPSSGPPVQSDAMLAKTTDGGRTWSSPKVILRRGRDAGSIASVIVPDPRRTRLYHFAFWQVGVVPSVRRPGRLIVQSSSDGGGHWSAPRTIAQAYTVALASREAYSGNKIRTGFAVPSFAVDRRSGTLYAAWQDARFSSGRRFDQIAFASSRDGGRAWSRPRRISRSSVQAFVPVVAVAPGGALGIAFYETAAGRSRHRTVTRYVLATSRDGGRTFATRTVGRPFDLAAAPLMQSVPELAVPPGLFLGDYMGIDAAANRFHLAFVTTNASRANATDVRYAVVDP
ncbi:MAG: sialidase family protein [Gaiellaceae bacterium]